MTVQELIDRLSTIKNKDLEVCFPYSYGTDETGNPLSINEVSTYDDVAIVYY